EHWKLVQGGPGKISPFFIPSAIVNLASGHISIRYGARGPNSATATACSASAHAIGDPFKIIERGAAAMMICGGTEATITPLRVGGFAAMNALRDQGCRADARRHRIRERAWYLDAHWRRDRDACAQEVVRRARQAGTGKLHEVHDRTFAGRCGWVGSRDQRAGTARPDSAADDQSGESRSGMRSRLRAELCAQGVGGVRAFEFVWFRRHQCRADFQALVGQIASPSVWAATRFSLEGRIS